MSQTLQIPVQTKADIELQKIVQLFSSETLPDYCKHALIDAPEKPSSKWSLGNQILMYLAGTEDARGFHQWKEVKRYVKKGMRSFSILAPTIINTEEEDKETHQKKKVTKLIGFHTVPVFKIEDTDGQPLKEYQPRTVPPLLDVAKKWGLNVKYGIERGAYGSFNPSTNTITIGTEEVAVFFHELAHSAHRRIEQLKPGQDPEQETIAELSSAVLSRIYGYNFDNVAWHYIAHYAKEKSPKAVGSMCLRVLGKVQKIVNMILSEGEIKEK